MTRPFKFRTGLIACMAGGALLSACILSQDEKYTPVGNPNAPVFFYSTNAAFFAPGAPIVSDTPHFASGYGRHFSVNPALPAGLFLDTAKGIISGTPSVEAATTTYVLTVDHVVISNKDTVIETLMLPLTFTISHWVGLPKDSLQNAVQFLLHGGEIYVANRSATNPGIGVIDTGTGKITAYYLEQLPPVSMALTQDNHLIVTETNYLQGAVSVVDLIAKTIQKSALSFGSDNFADTADGKVYLFDHATGVITGFSGHSPNQNIAFNVQTGANSNPYGIAISGNRAFVTRYNSKSLLVLDAASLGGGASDSIDLSAYVSRHPADTAAPAPRMASITAFDGYVFVALQRLNYKYSASDTSLVVVINASTKQVVSTIPLGFKNPFSSHVVGGMWYLTGIANYDQSGGVEKIDLVQRIHAGSIVSAQSLSADIFDFIPIGDHSGYVAYSTDYGYTTRVKKISY